jgi:hypothetical protein
MSHKSNMGARAQPDQIKLDSFVWPLIIAAVAAVLRIWHIQNSQISPTFWVPTVDPGWYHEAACRIAAGDWGPFPFFRAPAYPTLLGFVYRLFGENLVAARLLNVVLQALTVLSIYWVGRRYLSTSIGLIAAILFSLDLLFRRDSLHQSRNAAGGVVHLVAALSMATARRPGLCDLRHCLGYGRNHSPQFSAALSPSPRCSGNPSLCSKADFRG